MIIQHVTGLLTDPEKEWEYIRNGRCTIEVPHVFILAAIPAICFIGTTKFGWQIGDREPVMLTTDSVLIIAIIFYLTMLLEVFSVGKIIHWMARTYDTKQSLSTRIVLTAFTATPLCSCWSNAIISSALIELYCWSTKSRLYSIPSICRVTHYDGNT